MHKITLWAEYDETKGEPWPVTVVEDLQDTENLSNGRTTEIGKFKSVNDAQAFMLGLQLVYKDMKVEKELRYKDKKYVNK